MANNLFFLEVDLPGATKEFLGREALAQPGMGGFPKLRLPTAFNEEVLLVKKQGTNRVRVKVSGLRRSRAASRGRIAAGRPAAASWYRNTIGCTTSLT